MNESELKQIKNIINESYNSAIVGFRPKTCQRELTGARIFYDELRKNIDKYIKITTGKQQNGSM